MEGVNEPMVLKKLTLAAIDDSVTYEINHAAFDNIEAYRSI